MINSSAELIILDECMWYKMDSHHLNIFSGVVNHLKVFPQLRMQLTSLKNKIQFVNPCKLKVSDDPESLPYYKMHHELYCLLDDNYTFQGVTIELTRYKKCIEENYMYRDPRNTSGTPVFSITRWFSESGESVRVPECYRFRWNRSKMLIDEGWFQEETIMT